MTDDGETFPNGPQTQVKEGVKVTQMAPVHDSAHRRSIGARVSDALGRFLSLSEEEEDLAREEAGKPWRTAYYVASRDWPVVEPTGLTLEQAYEALGQMDDAFPEALQSLQDESVAANQAPNSSPTLNADRSVSGEVSGRGC